MAHAVGVVFGSATLGWLAACVAALAFALAAVYAALADVRARNWEQAARRRQDKVRETQRVLEAERAARAVDDARVDVARRWGELQQERADRATATAELTLRTLAVEAGEEWEVLDGARYDAVPGPDVLPPAVTGPAPVVVEHPVYVVPSPRSRREVLAEMARDGQRDGLHDLTVADQPRRGKPPTQPLPPTTPPPAAASGHPSGRPLREPLRALTGPVLTQQQARDAARAHEEGATWAELAEEYGVAASTVARAARRL